MSEQVKRLVKAYSSGIIEESELREALAQLGLAAAEIEAAVNG